MSQGWLQIAIFFGLLVAAMPLLGGYMARVFTGERVFMTPIAGPLERVTLRLLRVDSARGQDWKAYARSVIFFSVASWLLLFLILRTQTLHPLNPQDFHSGTWDLSFNTASSFVTNTNWQFYGGETTLSHFSQMAGLAVQNFVSAAVGMAVAVAVIRGIASRRGQGDETLGNFWVDLVRALFYVLVPLSIVGALFLVSQGVVQTLGSTPNLALGPVASQEIVKVLGTNGGGFFNVNSATPLENPNGLTNLVEMCAMLLIPVSLTYTYGRMVGSRRQGYAIFTAMSVLFVAGVIVVYLAEQHGAPAQHAAGIHTQIIDGSTGGNLEGKEQRFGIAGSALWAAVTTATSTGAVNSAFESLTGLAAWCRSRTSRCRRRSSAESARACIRMLLFVLLAVFIGGLMVGRTPEYLGKKIEPREVKLLAIGALFTPLLVLFGAGLANATKYGDPSVYASGPQGFSETLYAYASQGNNNGSAFAGYTGYLQPEAGNGGANGVTFADLLGGLVMLFGRFAPIALVLAVAGSLAGKRVSRSASARCGPTARPSSSCSCL